MAAHIFFQRLEIVMPVAARDFQTLEAGSSCTLIFFQTLENGQAEQPAANGRLSTQLNVWFCFHAREGIRV